MQFSKTFPVLISRTLISVGLIGSLLSLSGCRFGNFQSKNDVTVKDDGFTGFYRTAATRLSYCAKLRGLDWFCVPADLSIGSDWSNYIHDPQALAQDPNDITKVLYFTNVETSTGFRIKRDSATGFSGTLATSDLFASGNCSGQEAFQISGTVARQSGLSNFGGFAIAGRTTIAAQWSAQFDEVNPGDCTATQTAFESCYNDVTTCTGADATARQTLHDQLHDLLHNAVDTGALDATQIHNVEQFGYVVTYQ